MFSDRTRRVHKILGNVITYDTRRWNLVMEMGDQSIHTVLLRNKCNEILIVTNYHIQPQEKALFKKLKNWIVRLGSRPHICGGDHNGGLRFRQAEDVMTRLQNRGNWTQLDSQIAVGLTLRKIEVSCTRSDHALLRYFYGQESNHLEDIILHIGTPEEIFEKMQKTLKK